MNTIAAFSFALFFVIMATLFPQGDKFQISDKKSPKEEIEYILNFDFYELFSLDSQFQSDTISPELQSDFSKTATIGSCLVFMSVDESVETFKRCSKVLLIINKMIQANGYIPTYVLSTKNAYDLIGKRNSSKEIFIPTPDQMPLKVRKKIIMVANDRG